MAFTGFPVICVHDSSQYSIWSQQYCGVDDLNLWSYASHGVQCGVTTSHSTCCSYCIGDYHISFRLFPLSNLSVPALCLKDPRSGVDTSLPFLFRYSFFFFFSGKKKSLVCYLLSHKRVSIKMIFCCLLNNRFPLFFELLDNLATHITWPSEDPAELYQPPFVDLSNTACAWKNLTKQTVGS